MKKTILIMAAMVSLGAQAQKKWTLADCINYATENNITLKQARLKKQSANEDSHQAASAFLPSLSASTNQSGGYRPWQDAGITTVTNGTVNSKVDKHYYNGSYGLNANWTVWNGGQRINNFRLSRVTEQQAELAIDETANTIQEKITQLYVQILYMTEAINVNRQNLETSKKNEERGQQMAEVGKMSKADVAQLTAQRAADEYNIIESMGQLANYKLQLKQLLEITDTAPFEIAVPKTTDEHALVTIPEFMKVYENALDHRPEIKSALLGLKSGDLQIKIAKAGWMPSISMNGGVSTSTNSLSDNGYGKQLKTNFDATLGFGVTMPILDNRKTKTAVNKAKIAREQAQLDLWDKEKQLYSTIEGFWLDARTNQQKFRYATATVESEQQSYDLLQEQFNLGLKNIVELMSGKDKLLKAKQDQLQSKYVTILALQMLVFYQGGPIAL
jgi:outer membrane protein